MFLIHHGRRIEVPAALLETDQLPLPPGPSSGALHVTVRDPNWLYVHWDLTREQQAVLNQKSDHGHLVLRVHTGTLQHEPAAESHVHPQSRHWFAPVSAPGAKHFTELGLYVANVWQTVASAGPVVTPALRASENTGERFITIHPDVPLTSQLTGGKSPARSSTAGRPGRSEPEIFSKVRVIAREHGVISESELVFDEASSVAGAEFSSDEFNTSSGAGFGAREDGGENPESFVESSFSLSSFRS